MPSVLQRAGIIGLLFWTQACFSTTPSLIGKVPLGAPIITGSISADGARVVIQLAATGERPGALQIIDLSASDAPRLQSSTPLERGASMVVSPNGHLALLSARLTKTKKYNEPDPHEILVIEISPEGRPHVRERKEIKARRVALAPDASGYAYSTPAGGKSEKWKTIVNWTSDGHPSAEIDDGQYEEDMMLSGHASFLVYSSFGQKLSVVDLRAVPPIIQNQDDSFYARYRCIPILLPDGHAIVEDARYDWLGIYAFQSGVPRIAHLPRRGESYCGVLSNDPAAGIFRFADNSKQQILQLDLRDPEKPVLGGIWRLPPKTYAIATAGELLLAAGGDKAQELHIYKLDVSSVPAVDWSALLVAHQLVMKQYKEDGKERRFPYQLVQKLQEANVLLAMEEPVRGIAQRDAAAIMNDYGFLLSKLSNLSLAERALRRSVLLDPARALAHLNLADLLKKKLTDDSDWTDKASRINEIQDHYRRYLAQGGKATAEINLFLNGEPRGEGADVCSAIAAYANAGRLGELVSWSGTSINYGDRAIDLVFSTEGTAHVPVFYAYDSITDFPLQDDDLPALPPDSESLWGGDNLGLLVFHDGDHILNYKDLRHPVASMSLSDGDTCRFVATVTKTVGAKAMEPELCKNLQGNVPLRPLPFKGISWMTREDVSKRWGETEMVGTQLIDIANDGKPINVAKLEMASGAGAGCDETFFDMVDRNGAHFEDGPKRDLLMQLQGANASNRYPILPCGNKPSVFSHKGKVYFENRPAQNSPVDTWHQYHRVARVEGGKAVDVCDFKFGTTIKVQ